MENLSKLAETSVLGLLLAISLAAIAFMYLENKKERDARLKDLQEFSSTDRTFINEMKKTLESILDLLRGKA